MSPVVRIPAAVVRPSMWNFEVYHGFSRVKRAGDTVSFLVADDSFTTQTLTRKSAEQHNAEMNMVRDIVDDFIERATETRGADELYFTVLDFLDTWDGVWGASAKEKAVGQVSSGSKQDEPIGSSEPPAGDADTDATGEGHAAHGGYQSLAVR